MVGFSSLLLVGILASAASYVSSPAPSSPAIPERARPRAEADAAPLPAPRGTSAAPGPLQKGVPKGLGASGPVSDTSGMRLIREAPEGRRHASMESRLRTMLRQPRLRAGVFGVDLGSDAFFDLSGAESFPAASLIKVPIAAALLAEVDAGTVSLKDMLEIRASDIGGGSGHLQYLRVGTRFSVGRLAELMIRKSDNTATNMLIGRLGGKERLNQVFSGWGLAKTRVETPLPDLAGTNRTSPRDLVKVLRASVSGGLLRPATRDLLLSWMRRTHSRSLLPAGVGAGSRVANKTGDIPGALGDAGYVESPDGQRYLLAVQVERPRNSAQAKTLIRSVSRTVFESLTGLRSTTSRSSLRRPHPRGRRALRSGPVRQKAS